MRLVPFDMHICFCIHPGYEDWPKVVKIMQGQSINFENLARDTIQNHHGVKIKEYCYRNKLVQNFMDYMRGKQILKN